MNPAERAVRRFDAFQQRHLPTAFVFGVMKKYGDDNAGALTSNLAHSAIIAMFPLLLLLVTILDLVLVGNATARQAVLNSTMGRFPLVGPDLQHNLHAMHRGSPVALAVGLAGALWGSLGLAQAGIFTMQQVWTLPGPQRLNYLHRQARSLAFLVMLALGLIITTGLAGLGTFGQGSLGLAAAGAALSAVINSAGFLGGFRILTPKVVPLRHLVPGAVAGGVAWTIVQSLGVFLMGHYLHTNSAVFGMFAVVIALVAWVYLGAEITVYAAEVNVVLQRRLWPRAIAQPPLTEADQRSLAAQAEQNQRRPEQQVEVSFTGTPMTEDEFLRNGGEERGQSAPDRPAARHKTSG